MKDILVDESVMKNLFSELKRGDIVLAALILLDRPNYGYGLLKELQQKGLDITQDTLYPLLRRLESQGLIQGGWDTDGSRPRKIYQVTQACKEFRSQLIDQWKKQKKMMEDIL